jgi:hypothetical protein
MQELGMTLDNWLNKLKNNEVLRIAIGVNGATIPSASSHYDFINRIIDIDDKPKIRLKNRKPTKKLEKNVKQSEKKPGIVQRLVDQPAGWQARFCAADASICVRSVTYSRFPACRRAGRRRLRCLFS